MTTETLGGDGVGVPGTGIGEVMVKPTLAGAAEDVMTAVESVVGAVGPSLALASASWAPG